METVATFFIAVMGVGMVTVFILVTFDLAMDIYHGFTDRWW